MKRNFALCALSTPQPSLCRTITMDTKQQSRTYVSTPWITLRVNTYGVCRNLGAVSALSVSVDPPEKKIHINLTDFICSIEKFYSFFWFFFKILFDGLFSSAIWQAVFCGFQCCMNNVSASYLCLIEYSTVTQRTNSSVLSPSLFTDSLSC